MAVPTVYHKLLAAIKTSPPAEQLRLRGALSQHVRLMVCGYVCVCVCARVLCVCVCNFESAFQVPLYECDLECWVCVCVCLCHFDACLVRLVSTKVVNISGDVPGV